ncbi:MAG: MATE family efflux transporter, partial [Spirochaetes bacterium]|nr:MATE family efflux transporter [Spirochaetota bacterium]
VLCWTQGLGTQAIVSRRWGVFIEERKNNTDLLPKEIGEVLDNALILAVLVGCFAFCCAFLSYCLLPAMLTDQLLIENAQAYIHIFKWNLPILAINVAFTSFFGAIRRTKVVMIANLGSNFLNIFFNYLFIFGKWGFPALGIKGAALGTILASLASVLYLIVYSLQPDLFRKFRYFRFNKIQLTLQKNIIKTALPVVIQNTIAIYLFLVYKIMLGHLGTVYIGGTHIAFALFRLNKTIIGGFARGASILVGNYLGTGDKKSAKETILGCQFIALGIGIIIMTVVFLFPEWITRIFTNDQSIIPIGTQALRFFSFFFFIEVMGYSFETVFTSNGWGKFVLFSEFTTNIVFMLLLTWLTVIVFHLNIYYAWISFALYQIFHALILTGGFLSNRWQHIQVE